MADVQLLDLGDACDRSDVAHGQSVAGVYGEADLGTESGGGGEGARFGITVNAIAPGYVDTDMVRAVPPEVLEKIVARIPIGRLGHAADIARGVVFLTADEAEFITGSTLSINGGQHMY